MERRIEIKIRIEKIEEGEVGEIKNLEEKCGLSPWSLEDYKKEIIRNDSISLCAKVNNNKHFTFQSVVGFLIGRLITTLHSNFADYNLPEFFDIEIYNICVARSYRKKGIGSLLIKNALNDYEGKINTIWLEVRSGNKTAIKFYQSLNFNVVGVRKDFYSNPVEDGLILKMSVPRHHLL